jgi:hypothetical protein
MVSPSTTRTTLPVSDSAQTGPQTAREAATAASLSQTAQRLSEGRGMPLSVVDELPLMNLKPVDGDMPRGPHL